MQTTLFLRDKVTLSLPDFLTNLGVIERKNVNTIFLVSFRHEIPREHVCVIQYALFLEIFAERSG